MRYLQHLYKSDVAPLVKSIPEICSDHSAWKCRSICCRKCCSSICCGSICCGSTEHGRCRTSAECCHGCESLSAIGLNWCYGCWECLLNDCCCWLRNHLVLDLLPKLDHSLAVLHRNPWDLLDHLPSLCHGILPDDLS